MKSINFTPKAFDEFNYWRKADKKMQDKIVELIEDTLRTPFTGIGKPEPLKHHLKGFWSRRINQEHRIVYEVTETSINIISCRDHY